MKSANRGRASMLLSKAIAEAAVAVATQLVGQRLYAAYDAMRRYEAMRRRPSAGPGEDEERLPPTPEQVVERLVEEVIERSKQAFERHRPVLARARARTRVGLQQPAIAAVVVGGSVVGAVSALGVVPFALGAGAAYLVYRRLQPEDGAARPAS
ncbi:MAG TPA: hypothetical protein VF516_35565 [Kofleriaceae bacterium]